MVACLEGSLEEVPESDAWPATAIALSEARVGGLADDAESERCLVPVSRVTEGLGIEPAFSAGLLVEDDGATGIPEVVTDMFGGLRTLRVFTDGSGSDKTSTSSFRALCVEGVRVKSERLCRKRSRKLVLRSRGGTRVVSPSLRACEARGTALARREVEWDNRFERGVGASEERRPAAFSGDGVETVIMGPSCTASPTEEGAVSSERR